MYTIYNKSQSLSAHTSHKLQATSMVREGIEAVMNIRATNWMNFLADTDNCWNVADYESTCLEVWSGTKTFDAVYIEPGSYILKREDDVPRWILKPKPTGLSYGTAYIENYRIKKENGFWVQEFPDISDYKAPFFTREIIIGYHEDWTLLRGCATATPQKLCSEHGNPQKMKVTSIVQWLDNASSTAHKIQSEMILTNRK